MNLNVTGFLIAFPLLLKLLHFDFKLTLCDSLKARPEATSAIYSETQAGY
jgi:hypothetical protein